MAHLALGYVAIARRRTNEAVEECQRALDLNPNFAAAHGYLGLALSVGGALDESIVHSERAIRLSPHDPQNAIFNVHFAAAHYHMGRYVEAANSGRKAYNNVSDCPMVIEFTLRAWRRRARLRRLARS
jgi:tetratricopeptide (TPR) repeat protein